MSFPLELLSRVEEAGLNASAPQQQRLVDGWLVRFSPGKAKRTRCVNAISPGRLPIEKKLSLCRRVFDEAGLPMLLRITPFSEPSGLDAALGQRGLQRIDDTRVMVCTEWPAQAGSVLPEDLTLTRAGHEAFAQAVGVMRGSPLSQRQAHGQRLANAPVPFLAYLLKRRGELVACGQIAIENDLVGLYDVFTEPAARGQGLARILCSQLLIEAAERGATTAYLQVEAANLPARTLYRRLGFIDGYAYHYRTPDTVVV